MQEERDQGEPSPRAPGGPASCGPGVALRSGSHQERPQRNSGKGPRSQAEHERKCWGGHFRTKQVSVEAGSLPETEVTSQSHP